MTSNPRVTTVKAWRFEYELPESMDVYDGNLGAPSLDAAVIEFRDEEPNARIRSINGLQYYDDGIHLHRWRRPVGWR
ncbi:MAG: hypothetical protein AABP62_02080 [Planctomycetota bacterium]